MRPGNFAAGRADFAQALAIVRHIRQQHEHVLAAVKGQVLRQGQGDPRREKALHARRIGQGKEHDGAGQRAGIPEIADEELGHVMLHAHGGEHDGELDLLLQQPRLPHDLGGHAVVRQAVSGKDRQLLAADQRVHPVNGRQARLDEFARIAPGEGVDRHAVHIAPVGGERGRTAVGRPAQTVEDAPQHLPRNGQAKTFPQEAGAQGPVREAGRSFEDLHHGLGFRNVEHAAHARTARGVENLDHLVVAHVADPFHHDQRPLDARCADILQSPVFDVESGIHVQEACFSIFFCQCVDLLRDPLFQLRELLQFRVAEGGLGPQHLRHTGQAADSRKRHALLNQVPALAVERQNHAQERNLPLRRAVHVIFVKGALGEKTVLHDLGDEKDQALRIGQHIRPDELDDLLQPVLPLEERQRLGAQFDPVGSLFLPPRGSRPPTYSE